MRTGSRARALRPAALILCVCFLMSFAHPASAATMAGTQIIHPKAQIEYDQGMSSYSLESDQPAAHSVAAYYGLDTDAFSESEDVKLLLQGDYVEYEFGIKNKGNATDSVRLEIGPQSTGGAVWSVEVYDAGGSPLTWESGGPQADTAGDAATATAIPPGEFATFTLRVNSVSGADEGAAMNFSVTLKTLGWPAGDYTGFNSIAYGGPDSVSSATKTAQVPDGNPPAVSITSPADGAAFSTTTVTVAGTTSPPAASATVSIAGGAPVALPLDGGGSFSQSLTLTQQATSTISVTAYDLAHNAGSDSASIYVDSIAPELDITSPAEYASVDGVVTLSGRAWDLNFATYTLEYGPGASPAAWGDISTSGSAVASGTLGLWDTAGLFGTYTIRLSALDSFGNTDTLDRVVTIGNDEQYEGTVAQGEWLMMSIPGIPKDADPRELFGGSRYEVQQWDEDMEMDEYMKKFRRTFALNYAGEGFWIKSYEGEINYDIEARVTDTTGKYSIPLKDGWNQVGLPYNIESGMLWDSVYVKNTQTEEELTMTEAIAAEWIDSTFSEYTDSGYEGRGLGDSMIPFAGYFVEAYINCELSFDPGAGRPGGIARPAGRNMARIVRPQYEWRMQIAAESGEARDTDNFAAEMRGAQDGFDPGDSGEPPTVDPFVSLYFQNEHWQRNPGRYTRDSRAPSTAVNQEKTWNFVVEVSSPGDNVTISVADAASLPDNYSYVIRDNDTGVEFDPKATGEYSYTDSGQGRREFSLRAMKTGGSELIMRSGAFPAGWSLFSTPLEPEPTDVRAQLGGQLDDLQVFQYFDRNYYEPESEERVDIQAGIGYWIYLDEPKTLEFSGRDTAGMSSTEIPLVEGWNLIGNPYTHEINAGTLVNIKKEGQTLGLAEAAEAGWVDDRIYAYNEDTGGYERLEAGASLAPWKGYAVKALSPCTAVINAEP